MSALAIALTVAAAAGPTDESLLPLTERVQQFSVAARTQQLQLEVFPLAQRVFLRGPSAALVALAHDARATKTSICSPDAPSVEGLSFRCDTARLFVQLIEHGPASILVIRQLRGLPFASTPDGPPRLELPAEPDPFEDASALQLIVDGDQALARGAPLEAMRLYAEVRPRGRPGRLATARLAELSGKALDGDPTFVFSAEGLPPLWSEEMRARMLRVLAFRGDVQAALLRVDPTLCTTREGLCMSVLWRAMEDEDAAVRLTGLTTYAHAALSNAGPMALSVARAAALVAAENGALRWAARLLSSQTRRVPQAALEEHLLRIAQLYAQAGDGVRVSMLLDYASTLFPAAMATPPWRRVRQAVRQPAEAPQAPLPETEARSLDEDLAASALLRARARSVP